MPKMNFLMPSKKIFFFLFLANLSSSRPALADPKDPEHENMKEWIGGDFDPAAFDVDEVNRRLSPSEY